MVLSWRTWRGAVEFHRWKVKVKCQMAPLADMSRTSTAKIMDTLDTRETRGHIRTHADTRGYTRTHATTRGHTRIHADTHGHTRIHVGTRGHTSTDADTHEHTR